MDIQLHINFCQSWKSPLYGTKTFPIARVDWLTSVQEKLILTVINYVKKRYWEEIGFSRKVETGEEKQGKKNKIALFSICSYQEDDSKNL